MLLNVLFKKGGGKFEEGIWSMGAVELPSKHVSELQGDPSTLSQLGVTILFCTSCVPLLFSTFVLFYLTS